MEVFDGHHHHHHNDHCEGLTSQVVILEVDDDDVDDHDDYVISPARSLSWRESRASRGDRLKVPPPMHRILEVDHGGYPAYSHWWESDEGWEYDTVKLFNFPCGISPGRYSIFHLNEYFL